MSLEAAGPIVAVVAAYRRDPELSRLLEALFSTASAPEAAVVVDNAAEESTRATVGGFPLARYVASDKNIGPGYAWRLGMEVADRLLGGPPTHYLVLDDDVVVDGAALDCMVRAAVSAGAEMVAPLLSDAAGKLWGFPEPADPALRKSIREVVTPKEALKKIGPQPQDFCWCTGACVLVSRRTVEAVGPHRTDFWMLGEDLEFSMRVAARFRAVFTCQADVPHLPPAPPSDQISARAASLRKFHSLLTNLAYLSFHCPHSAHMRSYLAGNFRRYFRTEGVTPSTLTSATRCLWQGAVLGRPAGHAKSFVTRGSVS